MRIAGLQKLTLLDFPGKTAATVFTPGCNFRCPFCHNADLVTGEAGRDGAAADSSALSIDELFAFLGKRQGLLDGVCITGGEPLLQSGIDEFCTRVHELGFAVKLDTNGSFPGRLRALVEEGLVDYVATDVKNAPERYAETVGVPAFDLAPVQESLDFLRSGAVPYEVRTTVVRELHTADDLRALAACMVRRFGQPEGGALVLLGHGTEHFANMVYPAMQTALRLAGGRRAYMGTVEGWPGFDEVLAQLKKDGCGQALLVPFMLVAGDRYGGGRPKKLEKQARGRGRRGALPDAGPGRAAGGAGAVRCAAAGDSINL